MDITNRDEYQSIKTLIAKANKYIDILYTTTCIYSRNLYLYRLETIMYKIEQVCDGLKDESYDRRRFRQREFTLEELSKYNGKNGNPAYVSVNGTVYDVTNNAAWAAATHFGFAAGNDLTGAFNSCHASPSILEKLSIVGKLV